MSDSDDHDGNGFQPSNPQKNKKGIGLDSLKYGHEGRGKLFIIVC